MDSDAIRILQDGSEDDAHKILQDFNKKVNHCQSLTHWHYNHWHCMHWQSGDTGTAISRGPGDSLVRLISAGVLLTVGLTLAVKKGSL